ncbi:MFS transporter, partial [Janibacter sp. RAF20_2_2]
MLFGITGLGSAAVAVALPTLADDLEVSTGRAALVVSCYSLALAVGSAVCGRLGDLLGIRLPLLVGLAIMVTAASAGALVDSLPALVVTRTLQGLGASAAPALTLAL